MAEFNLKSPGIQVREIDFTGQNQLQRGITTGGHAGVFDWGPAETVVKVSNETGLLRTFGKPTENSALSFMSAANYLRYSNSLVIVRAVNANTYSTNYDLASRNSSVGIKRADYLLLGQFSLDASKSAVWATSNTNVSVTIESPIGGGGSNALAYVANTAGQVFSPGALSGVTITYGGSGYAESQFPLTVFLANTLNSAQNVSANLQPGTVGFSSYTLMGNTPLLIKNKTEFQDEYFYTEDEATGQISATYSTLGSFVARCAGALGDTLKISVCDGKQAWFSNIAGWENMTSSNTSETDPSMWIYSDEFDSYPDTSDWAAENGVANDEMHIIVIDTLGVFTGVVEGVLEKFEGVSKMKNAKIKNGASNYYRDVVLKQSNYVFPMAHPGTNTVLWGTNSTTPTANLRPGTSDNATSIGPLTNGNAGSISDDQIITALTVLQDKVAVDISLLFTGDASLEVKRKARLVANSRKDCVAFISPSLDAVKDPYNPTQAIIEESRDMSPSSYLVYDSGWKWQYDKYADKYRWVPLNADIAGLCARTDRTRDPWFSPAGTTRGRIQNTIKLAYNPTQGQRDRLYKQAINPVVTFPAEGTILFGDKTYTQKDTAFSRINVRRLFITVETVISRAARASLFEFNDDFTRSQFVNLIEPFLRTIKGRRGIFDYQVVCDSTNNTPDVVDANQFIGDIYIKPARSINYIQLNFVAVRTGVEFSEVVGRI